MAKVHCDKHPNIPFEESVGCEFCKAEQQQKPEETKESGKKSKKD